MNLGQMRRKTRLFLLEKIGKVFDLFLSLLLMLFGVIRHENFLKVNVTEKLSQ